MKIKTEKWGLNHSVPEVPLNPFTAFPLRRKMGFLFDAISKTVPSQKWMVFPKSLSREKKQLFIKMDSREKYQDKFVYCEEHMMLKILFFSPG